MLYQWEKLHAFACERQQQSQSLSQLSHALQDVQATIQSCNAESTQLKFSHIILAETCLKDTKVLDHTLSLYCCPLLRIR